MHLLSDGLIDFVPRYGLSQDSKLIGRKLCDNTRVLVASPATASPTASKN
ncbi:hypothetical protein [Zoogloea sp.]|nr:hypothetical protein [Zoogloea sp.]